MPTLPRPATWAITSARRARSVPATAIARRAGDESRRQGGQRGVVEVEVHEVRCGSGSLRGPVDLEDQVEDAPHDEQADDEDDDNDPKQYFEHEPPRGIQ